MNEAEIFETLVYPGGEINDVPEVNVTGITNWELWSTVEKLGCETLNSTPNFFTFHKQPNRLYFEIFEKVSEKITFWDFHKQKNRESFDLVVAFTVLFLFGISINFFDNFFL